MKDSRVVLSAGAGGVAVPLSRAFVAGFVASVLMLVAFGVAYAAALLLSRLPMGVVGDWFAGLTSNALINVARPNLYAATAVFLIGGLVWAMLYGLVFEPRLRGPGWQRGMIFSLLPWLFSLLVFMPLVGGGIFGVGLGAGPLPIIGNLILHLIYGAMLGVIYGPAGDTIPGGALEGDDVWASPRSQVSAARGVLAGLVLGTVAGLVVAVAPQVAGSQALGINSLWSVPVMAMVGAAFGGLISTLTA